MNCGVCGNLVSLYTENPEKNPVYNCKSCNLFIGGFSERANNVKNRYKGDFWQEQNLEEMIRTDFKSKTGQDYALAQQSMYSYCKKYLAGKKDILEIGAGTGVHLIMFDKMGFHVTGIEPDPRSTDFINQKLKHGHCINGFIEDLKIDEKFDVIFLYHAVEHIAKPDLLLMKCHNLLRDDGIIIIAVPDCENPNVLRESINNVYHLLHFSQTSLKKLADKLGYGILSCDSFTRIPRDIRRMHKMMRKIHLTYFSKKIYPCYPLKHTTGKDGYEIRLILRKKILTL